MLKKLTQDKNVSLDAIAEQVKVAFVELVKD